MNLFTEEANRQKFSLPLHALRGIAAVIVLLVHLQGRVQETFAEFSLPPIFNGSAAVNFFFVLSGLVVGASLAKNEITHSTVSLYFYRRFFRIMPLMVVTVTLGGLYLLFIEPHLNYALNPKEYGDFTLAKFAVGYVGYSLKANPPIWSIFVELIGSILIPLMLLSGTKIRNVLLVFVACIALSLIPIESKHYWHFYVICFYVGLSVLLWGRWLANKMKALPTGIFWVAIAVLTSSFYLARPLTGAGYGDLWIVYWETFSIAPVVAIIYYLPERFSLLTAPVFAFLGDVSYSLYLTHSLLLIALLNLVTEFMGHTGSAVMVYCVSAIICSFAVAAASYHTIELGGIRLGEYLRKERRLRLNACNPSH